MDLFSLIVLMLGGSALLLCCIGLFKNKATYIEEDPDTYEKLPSYNIMFRNPFRWSFASWKRYMKKHES